MGRSVSYAMGSEIVVYLDFKEPYEWDDFVDSLYEILTDKYKSLTKCDEWVGREDHAILENELIHIGISEYCGLVSLWVVPKSGDFYTVNTEKFYLARNYCNQIEKGFRNLILQHFPRCVYTRLGTFSNGESVYRSVEVI